MKSKNIAIFLLAFIGIGLFGLVQLKVLPTQAYKEDLYAFEQLEVTTHDINSVMGFKSPYMGNGKIIVLQVHLPLTGTMAGGTEMFPEILTTQFNYGDTLLNVGRKSLENKAMQAEKIKRFENVSIANSSLTDEDCLYEVRKSLIYNATASFALTANAECIIYNFTDITYMVNRKDVAALYDDFDHILVESTWISQVRDKLTDPLYVESVAEQILIRK
ncbi:MAG: hypothetical protein FWG40_07085 [Peptococcaceae bacterium]|nr:hypothetical protein [Peptococcaceae bacterium]